MSEAFRLSEEERRAWLEALLASGRTLVAPVDVGGLRLFRAVRSAEEIALEAYGATRWSPKELLFPSTEALFSYRLDGSEVELERPPAEAGEQVLFALRPCDAAGLARLDEVFLGDAQDAVYAERRARTTVVSLACAEARPECFCTAVGGSPAGTDGSDLQVAALEDGWLLRVVTDRGRALVEPLAGGWTPATEADRESAEERRRAVEATMAREPVAAAWPALLEGAFDHPLWAELGERCLSCGICAYVCPSCSCFDVDDDGGAFCGTRCRSWDSCTLARFTLHASGHNPRGTQPARYRQRALHKYAYFPLEHEGRLMCVGCGRCTVLCPVGIDVYDVVSRVAAAAAEAPA